MIDFAASQSLRLQCAEGADGGRVDVVAATAVSHPEVTETVMRLNERGIPVFALLNDFAQGVRQNYLD